MEPRRSGIAGSPRCVECDGLMCELKFFLKTHTPSGVEVGFSCRGSSRRGVGRIGARRRGTHRAIPARRHRRAGQRLRPPLRVFRQSFGHAGQQDELLIGEDLVARLSASASQKRAVRHSMIMSRNRTLAWSRS